MRFYTKKHGFTKSNLNKTFKFLAKHPLLKTCAHCGGIKGGLKLKMCKKALWCL
ncbi:hypothetical protein HAL09_16170 [Helicobacter ailurogastricus]|uniref:Uncharacterized protein n=1 Tax=Helicobacter ailurogastricus TaxID=1578720 RepID=A0A0K2X391_9HELI|nr:hypothetical protein HAL011_12040 [Helicobacter ailurogastricus]CRF44986.1 hypothetical protein HAL09_16170 [Helicobacter ailurogastricus]